MHAVDPNRLHECEVVEKPLIDQLRKMGWDYLEGDIDIPAVTERDNFHQVLLNGRLREALRCINLDDNGQPWLDDERLDLMLRRMENPEPGRLIEVNETIFNLLLDGTEVDGILGWNSGRGQICRYIDFEHLERNDFLVINQFRVDPPWVVGNRGFIIPDLVLFVNGIPLVVVECKSPNINNPLEEAINQLQRYANLRKSETPEGAERLFYYNQIMIATYRHEARMGNISSGADEFVPWRDTTPVSQDEVKQELGVQVLNPQQILVAGILRPEHLLDIVRNFTVFKKEGYRTSKVVCRYQQYRAVHKAIHRLLHGETRRQNGIQDQRGGIIWHYQGSGKSMAMVYLVRKLRTYAKLRNFKVVMVTDRQDLEDQLKRTASLTGETVISAKSIRNLFNLLRQEAPDLVFGMIQKLQVSDEDNTIIEFNPAAFMKASQANQEKLKELEDHEVTEEIALQVEDQGKDKKMQVRLPKKEIEVLNSSEDIVVIIDEAHRSHSSSLHQNLTIALPNCAMIGFTGTPIIMEGKKKSEAIFGSFIDKYRMKEAEEDQVIVPVKYEGKTTRGAVDSASTLDQLFEDLFNDRSPEEIEAIKRKYATTGAVLESNKMIQAKAQNILYHYILNILPNGFKAQLVASSRLAVSRYVKALREAHRSLLQELVNLPDAFLQLNDEQIAGYDEGTQFLIKAKQHEDVIKSLKFTGVISFKQNQPADWEAYTDKEKQKASIDRFKKYLLHDDPAVRDGLAFLVVKDMLITGFDAPIEQVLYLDRFMQGHELLQAIARVNRTFGGKKCGYVVDYCGIGTQLVDALGAYNEEDVEGVLPDYKAELPLLVERHRKTLNVFHSRDISDIRDIDACVSLLGDLGVRAEFIHCLKDFLDSMDIFLHRPEGRPYINDMKLLSFINQAAYNVYRDNEFNFVGCSEKVRGLLDQYLISLGINPKIPPISVTADDFPAMVAEHHSPKTRASVMSHAVRQYIRDHEDEDPVHYRRLSEHLEEILQQFAERWDELERYLNNLVNTVRNGPPDDGTGLDPRSEKPFLGAIEEEAFGGVELELEKRKEIANHVKRMLKHVRQEISLTDFWTTPYLQSRLRNWIKIYLEDYEVVPDDKAGATADALLEQARKRHIYLTKKY